MASSAFRPCCAVASPGLLASSRSKFAGAVALPNVGGTSRFTMSAEWMPGQPRPPYLDGSAPGDFGFDPLRLGEVPENLERFKESELIHCRWAMLAVPGILVPEALGLGNWVKAQEWAAVPGGQATYLGNHCYKQGNRLRKKRKPSAVLNIDHGLHPSFFSWRSDHGFTIVYSFWAPRKFGFGAGFQIAIGSLEGSSLYQGRMLVFQSLMARC